VPSAPVSRRALLTGTGGALLTAAGGQLLAGCGSQGAAPGRVPGASSGANTGSDVALVAEVTARITAAAALARRVPALAEMHTAHLATLQAPVPVLGAGPRRKLLRAEHDLTGQLADAALRAESGPLARLLASMSASVGQHLAAMPPGKP
jgi:hypothetical protein